ncbi:MAG: hypothetical protein E7432_03315 [Ruminococcaceae bacterium]|nr:hypothetical protein [Oscillospiraceae bacterium]
MKYSEKCKIKKGNKNMKKSRLLALTLVMAMMFAMLAGCSSKEETTTAAPAGNTTTAAGSNEPAAPADNARKDIVIAKASDVVGADPHDVNDTSSSAALRHMYNSLLVRKTETGELQPCLAESWEIPDDVTYKMKLREGVKFHNGNDFNAEDVQFSLLRAKEMPKVKFMAEMIEDVEIVDDYNVIITTMYPCAPFLANLAGTQLSIIDKETFEQYEKEGKSYSEFPVGTGVMKLKNWHVNDSFTMERWDGYWGEIAVADTVTYKVVPEESSRTIALQSGDVDMIDEVPPVDIDRVLEDDSIKTVENVSSSMTYVGWNMTKKPFDDVRVRKALAHATNKQDIIDVVIEGKGIEINTAWSALGDFHDNEIFKYEYDMEKAKALMAEAGYPDGFKANIALNSDERSRVAQVLQTQWADLGVELEITLMEWGAYLEHISGKSHDLFVLGWSMSYDPASTALALFHTESGGATGNRGWYSNPEMDKLIDEGAQLIDGDREPIYREIQRLVMDDMVFMPLYSKQCIVAMAKGLEGIRINPAGSHMYCYAYVNE